MLGSPREVCLRYSRGSPGRYHGARMVCIAGGKVVATISEREPG